VAAGFVGGAVQGALKLNANLNPENGYFDGGKLGANFLQGFAGGAINATADRIAGVSGEQDWASIATSAAGNAIGSSIATKFKLREKGEAFGRELRDAFGNHKGNVIAEGLTPQDETQALAKKLVQDKLKNALSDQVDGFQKAGLGGEGGIGEQVVGMGHDLDRLKEGVTGKDMEADHQIMLENHQRDLKDISKMAADAGLDEARSAILMNAFVLARYDALNTANPDFAWTQLGIFAANTVRGGIAQSYEYANAFDATAADVRVLPLASTLKEMASVSREMAQDILQGQMDVLGDVGTLSLMHQIYGAEALSTATFNGMTTDSRRSFRLQASAEKARANGDMNTFHAMQTEATVVMGMHEQADLQSMWDKPLMKSFAKFNGTLSEYGLPAFVDPDIYIGTNPSTANDGGVFIKHPGGTDDLSVFENRVKIARNGFETINNMQKSGGGVNFIEQYQSQLGRSKGLIQPKIPKQAPL
jgi:hypothetical protein